MVAVRKIKSALSLAENEAGIATIISTATTTTAAAATTKKEGKNTTTTAADNATPERMYGTGEEIANCLTHFAGFLLSIYGLVLLIRRANQYEHTTTKHIVALYLYGFSLMTLYLSSALYHTSFVASARIVRFFRLMDHCSIYLLIAGSYTPMCLISLASSQLGMYLFCAVWAIATFGIAMKVIYTVDAHFTLSLFCYLFMGWLAVFAVKPLLSIVPTSALGLMIGGGLSYTSGVFFFLKKWAGAHAIWHLFVMGGSACHYVAILQYVVPHVVGV